VVAVGVTVTRVPLVTAPTPLLTTPVPPEKTPVKVVEFPAVIVAAPALKLVITGGETPPTVRVKDWVAVPAVLVAVKRIGNVAAVVGVPLSAPVAAVNVTPFGKVPVSDSVGIGVPLAVTENEPLTPTVNVVLAALVNVGGTLPPVVPVPVRETDKVCALGLAAYVTCNIADFGPGPLGLNATLIAQLVLVARVAGDCGHLFVCKKLAGLVPATEMELIVSGPMPVLDKVAT
jgi:hypothetical protein